MRRSRGPAPSTPSPSRPPACPPSSQVSGVKTLTGGLGTPHTLTSTPSPLTERALCSPMGPQRLGVLSPGDVAEGTHLSSAVSRRGDGHRPVALLVSFDSDRQNLPRRACSGWSDDDKGIHPGPSGGDGGCPHSVTVSDERQ